ncbi:MAG: hypothetical protein OXU50_05670 [Gammaproteobacteria bacterium]|nr:hypothetical protein [Gammaproteobacteria bacterium]MDD9885926.1 hypothetical protein [Gammaproteobacteria bacterium]
METQSLQQTPQEREGVKARSKAGISLPLCNEISSILIGRVLTCREGGEELSRAQAAVRRQMDAFERFDVVYKQNTADELHIPLPCYDGFDEAMKEVRQLPDQDLRQLAGGEVAIVLTSAIAIAIGKIGLAAGLGFSVSVGAAGLTGAVTGVSLGAVAGGVFVVTMMAAVPVMATVMAAGVAAGIGVGIAAGVGAFDSSQSVSVNLAS